MDPSLSRLRLFWGSPIDAGVFFAGLLPWAFAVCCRPNWKVRGDWAVRLAFFSLSGVIAFALVLTASRGPFLGTILGTAVTAAALARLRPLSRRNTMRTFIVAGGLLIGMAAFGQLGKRLSVEHLGTDRSVINRIAIWRGGLTLLFARPFTGVGAGESGYLYSQWLQGDATSYLYTGMLNSWLELGVELGIPCLLAAVFGTASVLVLPFFVGKAEGGLAKWTPLVMSGSVGSLAAIATSGLSSTVLDNSSVRALFFGSALLLLITAYGMRGRIRYARIGGWATFAVAITFAGTWVAATYFSSSEFEVRVAKNSSVSLRHAKRNADNGISRIGVLCDRKVSGPLYGALLRDLFRSAPASMELVAFDPRRPIPDFGDLDLDSLLVFGRACSELDHLSLVGIRHVVLIHPVGAVAAISADTTVSTWLPAFSVLGDNGSWTDEIRNQGWPMHSTQAKGGFLSRSLVCNMQRWWE